MRLQTEAALNPIAPVSEIPADLAELRPGQAFSARIQEVLPENTYKALVAGRSLTLALPEGAKAGDTLELVVIDRTPRLVVAQLANRNAPGDAAATDYEFTSLSPTARLIGALLARDGAAPPPAALTPGPALLAAASADTARLAADLAPQLAKAVSQSGLFYEAHQVQWVMGQRPLNDLLVEPQARHAPAQSPAAPAGQAGDAAIHKASGGRPGELPGPMVLLQDLFGVDEPRQQPGPPSAGANPAQAVPEDLRPLVQQQLDAAATQRLAWHGEVWPGQSLNWQIEPDQQRSRNEPPESAGGWITSLRLVTPRLGEIDARLSLTPHGARIVIATPSSASAADLRGAASRLEQSMATAGVPLLALQVKHESRE
jgi:hypothetical protein